LPSVNVLRWRRGSFHRPPLAALFSRLSSEELAWFRSQVTVGIKQHRMSYRGNFAVDERNHEGEFLEVHCSASVRVCHVEGQSVMG
jgi:hypothetical protein